jgi:hypothetical protein
MRALRTRATRWRSSKKRAEHDGVMDCGGRMPSLAFYFLSLEELEHQSLVIHIAFHHFSTPDV